MAIATIACLAAVACAPDARYRVLNFFFDGVPKPGEEIKQTRGYPILADPDDIDSDDDNASAQPTKRTGNYAHPPFRKNQCDVCHNRRTGRMTNEPEDGLCATCHSKLWRPANYVHGPIAAQACLFCHHHHTSKYPAILLIEPPDLCWKCHDRDDLTPGDHHETADQDLCTDCHDPHSGSDPFFLKRTGP